MIAKKGTTAVKKMHITIVVCILLIFLIPFSIWLLNIKSKNFDLNSYHGTSYTFYYPKSWTITKSGMQIIKGTAFYLAPPHSGPPKTPHVYIEVAPANPTSISDMTDAFIVFKYTKTTTMVDGVDAQRYSTIVPSSEGVLHSIAYIFVVKGNIYLIKLGYKQQATDSQLENEFVQIVTTFAAH